MSSPRLCQACRDATPDEEREFLDAAPGAPLGSLLCSRCGLPAFGSPPKPAGKRNRVRLSELLAAKRDVRPPA